MHEDRLLFWEKKNHDDSAICASPVLNMEGDVSGAVFFISFLGKQMQIPSQSKTRQTPISSSPLASRVLGTQKTKPS